MIFGLLLRNRRGPEARSTDEAVSLPASTGPQIKRTPLRVVWLYPVPSRPSDQIIVASFAAVKDRNPLSHLIFG